ncbi:Type III secretory pathway protein [gamma proteobacterium HdN1]|nr:Type III secretory pathway protein [gamma proteobacterium HdN1]
MDYAVIQLTQEALWLLLMLSAPIILGAAASGLVIAFLQAVTQLQEQTLGFAVKLVVVSALIFLTSGLVGETLFQYASRIFTSFPALVGP